MIETLLQRVERREATIGVIGLGYVGLPVASTFANAGFQVIGVERDAARVREISAGRNPIKGDEPSLDDLVRSVVEAGALFATTDYSPLASADVVTLNVETPVGAGNAPSTIALEAACDSLGPVMKHGTLVIVESTVAPGTTVKTVGPRLEAASGLRAGSNFYIGACPERVMPGKLLGNIRSVARVCGADDPTVGRVMQALYGTVVDAELDVADITTAELVKVTENAYRDVQIAFANEVALICEELGIDVWRVRELVNKVPYRQMHRPGGGVGGHCLPKDPWLLAAAVERAQTPLIKAARAVNDSMPAHIANVVTEAVKKHREERGIRADHPVRVAVLGISYLPESDDTRNSPSLDLVDILRARGVEVSAHDPFAPGYDSALTDVTRDVDAIVLMVHHGAYKGRIPTAPVFVDAERLADVGSPPRGPVQ